jgi:hypothetical protein
MKFQSLLAVIVLSVRRKSSSSRQDRWNNSFLFKLSYQEASSAEPSAYALDFLIQLLDAYKTSFPNHFLTMSKIEEAIAATVKVLDPDSYALMTSKDRESSQ